MSKIWFTSDTHFNQERTLKLSKRPFKTVDEMNETIINNWNKVVRKDDLVFHLGDFGDYTKCKQLNGKIVLIKGNYENTDIKSNKITNEELFDNGFLAIWNKFTYKLNDNIINMAHKPSKIKDMEGINLFGHIHKLCMVKPYGLNVGMDVHNFYPIDFETVLFYYNGIKNYYDEEVFN